MSNHCIVYVHQAVLGTIAQKASEQRSGGKGSKTMQEKYLQPSSLVNLVLPLFLSRLVVCSLSLSSVTSTIYFALGIQHSSKEKSQKNL